MPPSTTLPTTPATPPSPSEKLMADLKVVIADAEELLKLTAGQAGDKAADLRQRIADRLATSRSELARLQAQATSQAREAGKAADQYVRENPWAAIGVAAGVGLVLGLLISRR
ncbi:MAG TPA: DUF883 family protein [Ramlibacter sp.]|nr:DUF883 family protein [Ramlibacter sp.]